MAAQYHASSITGIAVGSGGEVYIRWVGLPKSGLRGDNNSWVMVPAAAPEAMKSLAISLYFDANQPVLGVWPPTRP